MKRIIICLLAALLLAACRPTPKEDVRQLYLSAIDGGAVEPRMTREALMAVPE